MMPSSANPASDAISENQENKQPMLGSDSSQLGSQQENQPPAGTGNRGVRFSSPMKFGSSAIGSSPRSAAPTGRVHGRSGLRDAYSTSPMRFDHLASQDGTARRRESPFLFHS
jgi:hypothetical protein